MAPRTVATGVLLGMLIAGIYVAIDKNQEARHAAAVAAESEAPAPASAEPATTPPHVSAAPSSAPPTAPTAEEGPPPSDPHPGMVLVSGGSYQPTYLTHAIDVKPFYLDVTLVTRSAYLACESCTKPASTKKKEPPGDLPIVEVTWADAVKYCAGLHKRLPAEAEFEFAARGPEGRRFAWGNDPPPDHACWKKGNGPCPVGSYPAGDTPLGLKDMTGNVWEWMGEDRFCPNPERDDSCEKSAHTMRGGAWNVFVPGTLETSLRLAMRAPQTTYVGFRCAAD